MVAISYWFTHRINVAHSEDRSCGWRSIGGRLLVGVVRYNNDAKFLLYSHPSIFSILSLENETMPSFKTSVTAHFSTKTSIQEAMNTQKHYCENLKCSKCDTAVRKERKKLVARRRNIRKGVLNSIRER